jgi:hypothetical protein
MPKQQTDASPKSSSALVRDYIKYFHLPEEEKERSHYYWADDKLYYLVQDEPETAWAAIEEIIRVDASDAMLAYVAAGPIEHLLVQHGDEFIERIEQSARRDPTFRKMLGAVWRSLISEEVWKRLKAVAGPSF